MKKFIPKSKLSIGALILLVVFFGFEITLRNVWGFGHMVLFQEDESFEYIPKANQNLIRFGKTNGYNEYSMRSLPMSREDKCIILGFGDSVINGGTLTSQDSLATTLVENELQYRVNKGVRFLNISAGSWGPDNCAAYLKKYGSFDAKMIVLFVSSHDAHDNMTFEKTVGVHSSYPEKQYPLAMLELLDRYIKPRFLSLLSNSHEAEDLLINKNGVGFNSGFDFFHDFTKKNKIPFIVCLHAERKEVEEKQYGPGGEEILQYCNKNNIKVISGLQIGEDLSDFRDQIHVNETGQKRWANVLFNEIYETIKTCN